MSARSRTRSMRPVGSARSRHSSTIASITGISLWTARGVKARLTRLRIRVWFAASIVNIPASSTRWSRSSAGWVGGS